MRIGLVSHEFPPYPNVGGTGHYAYNIARMLRQQGHEVCVFALQRESGFSEREEYFEELFVHRVFTAPTNLLDTIANPQIERAFEEWLREISPDVLHLQHLINLSLRLPTLAKQQGIPVVLTLHDFWLGCQGIHLNTFQNDALCTLPKPHAECAGCVSSHQEYSLQFLELREKLAKQALNEADLVLCPSNYLRKVFEEDLGWPGRYRVLQNGTDDFSPEPPPPLRNPGTTFGFLANVNRIKGLEVLLKAFRPLSSRARLLIYGNFVGDPSYLSELRALVEGLPNVFFLGGYDKADLPRIFSRLDAIVVPSLFENCPLVVLEAMQAKVPAIASDVGGIPELVRHEKNGLLFRRGDPADLNRMLERLIHEPGLLDALRQGITPPLTWREHLDSLLQHYRQIFAPKLRVAALLPSLGNEASTFLRVESPFRELERRELIEYHPLLAHEGGKYSLRLDLLSRVDVVLVQREMAGTLSYSRLKELLGSRPVKVVYEIDDLLTAVPEGNPAYGVTQEMLPQVEEYLREADLVVVSTDVLRRAFEGYGAPVVCLPNAIDPTLWRKERFPEAGEKVRILFSGTPTHEKDLAVIEEALVRILEEFGERVEIKLWGNSNPTLLGYSQVAPPLAHLYDYPSYVKALLDLKVDFAVVPLEDIPFNRAKSNIKWLEYSACGIPVICSALPPYSTIDPGRTGLLAQNTVDSWYEAIKQLIVDSALRRQLAENARAEVLEHHALGGLADGWKEVLDAVLCDREAPPVSIIMPLHDELSRTQATLEAVIANTPEDLFEVILVDNASTDGTSAFLAQLEGDVQIIRNPENLGFSQACRQGAAIARGRALLFLESGVLPRSGWLEPLLEAFEEGAVIGGKTKDDSWILPISTGPHAHEEYPETLFSPDGAVLVPRDCTLPEAAFDSKAFFDELRRNEELLFVPQSLVEDPRPSFEGGQADFERAPVSIVILTYNSSDTIETCVESVLSTIRPEDEVLLVDNASRDETPRILDALAKRDPRIRCVYSASNLGFSAGTNLGIRQAKGEFVVLLNPDTVVFPGWLEEMVRFAVLPGVGAVGPLSDYVAGPQKWQFHYTMLSTDTPISRVAREFPTPFLGRAIEVKLLVGFCMLIPRWILDEVGLLDEDLFLGNDDLEISWRLRRYGKKLLAARGAFVQHLGQVSFDTEPKEHTRRLVQESTDVLARKLVDHYGPGKVPSAFDLWGIDWFLPTPGLLEGTSLPEHREEQKKPIVSVIITTFNRPELLPRALDSVLAQTLSSLEIVVVNDGGVEVEGIVLAKGSDKIRYLRHEANRGVAAARNTGIKAARGKYIAFLDDDDAFYPEHLETLVDFLKESGQGVAYSNAARVMQQKVEGRYVQVSKDVPYASDFDAERILGDNFIPTLCLLIERACLEDVGLFDERLPVLEDWELWIRLSRKYPPVHLDRCTCEFSFRDDGSSMTSSRLMDFLYARKFIYRWHRGAMLGYPRILDLWRRHLAFGEDKIDMILTHRPKYSVVLMVHQDLQDIYDCLEALSNHSPEHWYEVVVVDNASQGELKALLSSLEGDVRVIRNGENLGLSQAWIQGALAATGDTLLFLTPTTRVAPGWMDAVSEALREGGVLLLDEHAEGRFPVQGPLAAVPRADFERVEEMEAWQDFLEALQGKKTNVLEQRIPVAEPRRPKVSIVVLTLNQLELTKICFESLYRHTTEFELVVIDNGSTDGTIDYLSALSRERKNVRVRFNRSNRGFAGGCNQGIAIATGEHIVLLNNDTIVTEGWLETLLRASDQPAVGIVGPRSNYVVGLQLVEDARYDLDGLEEFARQWKARHFRQSREVNRVIGFCMLIRREVIETIGGLDTSFGTGNYEDDDYCLRALVAGFRILVVDEVFIHHFGNATFKGERIDYRETLQRNWELFKRKWCLPGADSYEKGYRFQDALRNPFDPSIHAEPLFSPAVPAAALPEQRRRNIGLFESEGIEQTVRAFIEAFEPGEDVMLHLFAGKESEQVQQVVLEVLGEIEKLEGLDTNALPDISLLDAPTSPLELPACLRAMDLVLGSRRVLQGAEDMGVDTLPEPTKEALREWKAERWSV